VVTGHAGRRRFAFALVFALFLGAFARLGSIVAFLVERAVSCTLAPVTTCTSCFARLRMVTKEYGVLTTIEFTGDRTARGEGTLCISTLNAAGIVDGSDRLHIVCLSITGTVIDYGLSLVGSTSEYDGLRVWMISNQPTQATRGRGDGEIGRHIVLHIVAGHCELLQIAARVSIED